MNVTQINGEKIHIFPTVAPTRRRVAEPTVLSPMTLHATGNFDRFHRSRLFSFSSPTEVNLSTKKNLGGGRRPRTTGLPPALAGRPDNPADLQVPKLHVDSWIRTGRPSVSPLHFMSVLCCSCPRILADALPAVRGSPICTSHCALGAVMTWSVFMLQTIHKGFVNQQFINRRRCHLLNMPRE